MDRIGISQSLHKAIESTLHRVFHLSEFRPLQREIITRIFMDQSQLAILPTGAGKSLCYQLPSALLPSPTVVISPLLSLMQEQAQRLRTLGLNAVTWSHWDHPKQRAAVLEDWRLGKLQVVFLAPERLRHPELLRRIGSLPCSLLVVDEAHSISEWGHDFRPDYRRIGQFRREVGSPPILALTATATPVVEQDILHQLGLDAENCLVTRQSMDRPNIFLEVQVAQNRHEQHLAVYQSIHKEPGAVIVYAATRRQAEYWGQWINRSLAEPVGIYHAGLSQEQRIRVHQDFSAGALRLVVATTAFGMGIDRSDVRGVLNLGMPPSLDAYAQQWGRAGRDGERAWARLVVTPGDMAQRHRMIVREAPDVQAVQDIMTALDSRPLNESLWWDFSRAEGEDGLADREALWEAVLISLEEMQAVEVLAKTGHQTLIMVKKPVESWMIRALKDRLHRRYRHRLDQYEHMRAYITVETCRRDVILVYFGQVSSSRADGDTCCDLCAGGVKPGFRGGQDVLSLRWQRLRTWRQDQAKRENVSPYIIFSDHVLRLLAAQFPETPDQLRQCPGIGPTKFLRYGEMLLKLLKEDEIPPIPQRMKTAKEQSWDLFAEGVPVAQVASRVNRKPSTVIGYLEEWIACDTTQAWRWYGDSMVHPQVTDQVAGVLSQNPEMTLKGLFAALNGQLSYDGLRIARAMVKKSWSTSHMGRQPDSDAHTSSGGQ